MENKIKRLGYKNICIECNRDFEGFSMQVICWECIRNKLITLQKVFKTYKFGKGEIK